MKIKEGKSALEQNLYRSFLLLSATLVLISLGFTLFFDISRQRKDMDKLISGTASYIAAIPDVAAMLENGLYNGGYPVKLYYKTSCYRYEKPQAGRLRELHQFGVEMFGTAEPAADAQVIAMAMSIFNRLGLADDIEVSINSIGCPTCRAEYRKALRAYFEGYKDQLCETCNSRLERNPMRILDCKSPVCGEIAKGAPKITDYLCDDCRAHFEKVQTLLKSIDIPFSIDPGLVRGLDYYTRTVFEFPSKRFGFALGGGGS